MRISNSFERDKVSIDDIRKKAYGSLTEDLEDEFRDDVPNNEVVEDEENLLVDLNDEKPTVKEVTMGDAVEYFEDLGLEYNVDYKDTSYEDATKKKTRSTRVERHQDDENDDLSNIITDSDVSNNNDSYDNLDENLFDLVDSIYEGGEE